MNTASIEVSRTEGRSTPPGAPRIAVVGCGAIARSFHLPALTAIPGVVDGVIVVDRDAARAHATQQEFHAHRAVTDHRRALEEVDGAIVAVPQEFHAEVAMDFLRAGVPVLCEKPLTTTVAEAVALVEAASAARTLLAVNNTRRLYPAAQAVRSWIRSVRGGRVRRIEVYEGMAFGWPLASGTAFGRAGTRKGVLQDTGAHTLDMICWWLGARPSITQYLDDAMGGSEAEARVEFAGDGYTGVIHLSWLNRLSNTFRVEGEQETVEGRIWSWDEMHVTSAQGRSRRMKLRAEVPSFAALNAHVITNFLGAIRGECPPAVPANEVLDSIAMIEECYRRRQRFPMPWYDTAAEVRDVVR